MPPLAHSTEEIELYLRLHPCECGESEPGGSSVRRVDGGWVVRYSEDCAGCGRPRLLEFRLPELAGALSGAVWSDSADPSELLDAGEWCWVADSFGGGPADLTGLSEDERVRVRVDRRAAAAALDEVLKFVPEGADQVPESAFWSDRGRAVRERDPDRFSRLRLAASRAAYRRLLAEAEQVTGVARRPGDRPRFSGAVPPRDGAGRVALPDRLLAEAERAAVAGYLRGAPMVLACWGLDPDPFDPAQPEVVPAHLRSDGHWVWSESLAYFAERYGVPPEPELLAHIEEQDYEWPVDLDDEVLDRVVRALRDEGSEAGLVTETSA
ncbi:hypothetical protein [Plantactinospora mayteni]|nr:hypothetical protein [Plantactinospora mayteni]